MPWSATFDDPIDLPDGRKLRTLNDAAEHIMLLSDAEHRAPEWQLAMEALILIAEGGGPTMLARIGVMSALNRHVVVPLNPGAKTHHWGKRKLEARRVRITARIRNGRARNES